MSLSIVALSYGHTGELDLNYIGSKLDNSGREFKSKDFLSWVSNSPEKKPYQYSLSRDGSNDDGLRWL